MISIIICSKYTGISQLLNENIKNTIGTDYEIIVIDNSQNKYSIFSAYNKGINQSKYPFLCFAHEDVMFKTYNWGQILIKHLSDKKTGIIGVAGGKIMAKVPAQWSTEGRCINIIQYQPKKKISVQLKEPQDFLGISQSVIILDGVFLSARRELFDKIKFDENFLGFHGYDYDISAQSIVAGYNNYVIFDIWIEHFSKGNKNAQYYANLIEIFKKWNNNLPLYTPDNAVEIKTNITKIEKKRLEKLTCRMARTGFSTKVIVSEVRFFIELLKSKGVEINIKNIRISVFITRLFNAPKHLFK